MTPTTLPALLLAHARERPDAPALREKRRGRWHELTWSEYAARVARVAAGLRALGVEPGDRVAVHGENRPEWVIADLAIQGIGGCTVGVYPTSPAAEVEYLLGHSESVVLVAEDEEQLDKALAVRERLPELRKIVLIDPRNVRALDDPMVMTWEELEGEGSVDDFAQAVDALDPRDAAVIVYTSGTTGPPKGAMLTHANLTWAADSFRRAFRTGPDDEVLSYLPLCHVAERLGSVINGLGTGYVVNFGEGGESFAQDLRDVQPTLFAAVPRVWEKMLATVEIKMADASWFKRAAYRTAMRIGRGLAAKRMQGALGPADRLRAAFASALALRALRDKLGLGRAERAVCGAAPIAPQVLEFFWALGIPVYEIYGQTENTAVCTFMPFDDVRIGTVGKPLEGVEVRIAGDGEILTRSPAVFAGYFKDDAATADAIDPDGWLHTGDVGTIDEHGHLTITDRKKDVIITAGGKNVSPSEIENRLKVSPYVREAMVVGDRRKYLVALIGIEADTVSDWAARRGLAFTTYGDLSRKEEVRALVGEWVDQVNSELAQVETIKRFALLEKELDHEDGELTATLKVKRRALERQFERQIEASMDEFIQLCFNGLALGARYALVALGFVIIYRATGVINFAQGALVALGAYLTYAFANGAELPFALAVLLAVACASLFGAGLERTVLRKMVGEPVFAVIMITIGLLFIIEQAVTAIWGFDNLNLADPWGVDTVRSGGVVMAVRDLWTLGIGAVVLAGFFVFFRLSTLGVAMRATAFDAEAALAQGISARRVFAVSWAISAGLAALAGVTLASGPAALSPTIGAIALVAFPAMIVGGMDSPAGAVAGGLIIGLTQALTAGYQEDVAPWLGQNFGAVMPYVVMIVILLVRPYGLFGTREVRRV